ncbi:MAG: hypothetical protein J5518_03550 [Lachnospiraceae bacterium]|nr:hypothetical protein [Lachnospiraceae bacterium]
MKKKKLMTLLLAGLLTVCMCVPALAAEPDSAGNIMDAGNMVSLPSTPFFGAIVAGQSVNMTNATAKGSVFAAGQDVSVQNSEIGESVYLAGNSLSLHDTKVNGNIYGAGNSLTISGDTSGNGVYAVGNLIKFDGTANGFYASGSQITLSGTVNGDAILEGENIEITDDAVVTGKLKIVSSAQPEVDADAEVGDYSFEQVTKDTEEDAGKAAMAGMFGIILRKIGKCIYWIIAMVAFGMLLCWLFDEHLTRATVFIKERAAATIVSGLVAWMCIPLAAIILCCTYFLAPIAGMLALAYVLLLCAGLAFAGASLSRLVFPNMNVFLSALIGIAVLEVVGMIPILGGLVGIAADMYLLGYVIQNIWDHRLQKKVPAAPVAPAAAPVSAPVETAAPAESGKTTE